jgi:hypothetical protein
VQYRDTREERVEIGAVPSTVIAIVGRGKLSYLFGEDKGRANTNAGAVKEFSDLVGWLSPPAIYNFLHKIQQNFLENFF